MQNELKIRKSILWVFSAIWIGILLIDYWDKHPLYWYSITHFKYLSWSIILLTIGSLLGLYCSRSLLFKSIKAPWINGLVVYLLFIIGLCLTAFSFNHFFQAELNFSHYWHLVSRSTYTLVCSFIVLLSALSSGHLLARFAPYLAQIGGITTYLVHLALGFFIIILGLFFLGYIGQLKQLPVLIWLLIFPISQYQYVIKYIKKILITPFILDESWSFWGYFAMYIGLIYSTINFFFVQAPFPLGFDARNYYVNISKLLAESGSLVEGFQPYAWSLLTSVGYIAFYSPEVTLFLSTLGGYITCWGIYELGTRYLKLNKNYALWSTLLFMITPAINNHWIIEFKIDLSLLFIQFAILNLLFHWFFEKKKTESSTLIKDKNDWMIVVVIAILMGFSLSIKVLSVFLTYSVFLLYWLFSRDKMGALGLASIGVSLTLLLKLDEISGLRAYHDLQNTTAIIFILIGVALLSYSIYKNGVKLLLRNSKPIVLSGLIMIGCFSPWLVKNYSESSKKDVISIILGGIPNSELDLGKMLRDYKKQDE